MTEVLSYQADLLACPDWEDYLCTHARTPHGSYNLRLASAAALHASAAQRLAWQRADNEFLAMCAALAYGMQLARGDMAASDPLRALASDPRASVREASITALQYLGKRSHARLMLELQHYVLGNLYEQIAAVQSAAVPSLLQHPEQACPVLHLLETVTASLARSAHTGTALHQTLMQTLAQGWALAAAALPHEGLPMLEAWVRAPSEAVRAVLMDILTSGPLQRAEPAWCAVQREQLVG